jgi:hypothetical protein
MEKQMLDVINLEDRVIQLHDIAREIEQEIGKGALAEEVRRAADTLSKLINETL